MNIFIHRNQNLPMRQVLIFLTILSFASCKKSNEADENPVPTGLVPASLSEMLAIKTVESIDTSTVPVFERRTSSSIILYGFPEPGVQVGSSCTGWALGYGMMSYFYNIIGGPYEGSPTYIWNQLNGGNKKQGITIPQGMELLKTQGCAHTSYMPTSINYTGQPDADARANAEDYKIHDYYRFDNINLERIKSFLRRNYPLPFGVNIDEGFGYPKASQFDSYSITNGELLYKKKSGKDLGDHAMLIVGYDDKMGPNGAFKIMNSWGNTWANNGFVWIDYKMFTDMVVMTENKPNIFWAVPSIIRTLDITAIGRTEATIEGKADSYEGSLLAGKGICYSDLVKKPDVAGPRSFEGQGKGTFRSKLTGLTPGKKYYVRAYAITSTGEVKYGVAKEFNTSQGTGFGTIVAGGNGNGVGLNQIGGSSTNYGSGLQIRNNIIYIHDVQNTRLLKWPLGASAATIIESYSNSNFNSIITGFYVDASNNIYIAYNNRVEKNGIKIASIKDPNYGNDLIKLYKYPRVDNNGNLFVYSHTDRTIQKWPLGSTTPNYVAGTLAGSNLERINGVVDMELDANGNLYVADVGPCGNRECGGDRMLKFTPGIISATVVLNWTTIGGFDIDINGNIYLPAPYGVHKYAQGSSIYNFTPVAGGNSVGSGLDQVNQVSDVKLEGGKIYFWDYNNNRVMRW